MLLNDYPWMDKDRRYRPRPGVISRMSNLHEEDDRYLSGDLDSITLSLKQVGGANWDPFLAHTEIPASKEGEAKHTPEEVVRLNHSALSFTDGLIAHGYGGGSTSLGWELREAATSCRCLPVLIVVHVQQTVSKHLLGLQEDFWNVSIQRFRDDMDLVAVVENWLVANLTSIDEGPNLRRELDNEWGPTAELILERLEGADGATRAMLRKLVPNTARGIQEAAELVTPLADMPAAVIARIMAALGIDLLKRRLLEEAKALLDPIELQSWRVWSKSRNNDFTWKVLDAAVEERRRPVIARQPVFFAEPGTWNAFAQRWINRAGT